MATVIRGSDNFDTADNATQTELDAKATLSHNGSTKLATTSTGVDITGTVTADGLTVDGNLNFTNGALTINSGAADNSLNLDSSGNVGIGTTSPSRLLDLKKAHTAAYGSFTPLINLNGYFPGYDVDAQRATIDAGVPNAGNTTYGHIGFSTRGADGLVRRVVISNIGHTYPGTDNTQDIGTASYRWDDVYATNGTIQTSDRNEKQDIEALDEAEQRVAVAAKGLLRKFRWKSAIAEKGEDARIHFGIIAQDLQDAFTAEGLDAGRYAMFISSTWWEDDRVVPAVEGQEAVYETVVVSGGEQQVTQEVTKEVTTTEIVEVDGKWVQQEVTKTETVQEPVFTDHILYDTEGNEIGTHKVPVMETVSEVTEQRLVTEAVDAVAEHTVTDTFETLEEAPEGATERTRLGVRYPELLAFIISAI